MVKIGFGKSKRFACVTSQPLAKRVVPALHVSEQAGVFVDLLMRLFRKNLSVSRPEIAEGIAIPIGVWNAIPHAATSRLTAVTNGESNDLACPSAHDGPQPTFMLALRDKVGKQQALQQFYLNLSHA